MTGFTPFAADFGERPKNPIFVPNGTNFLTKPNIVMKKFLLVAAAALGLLMSSCGGGMKVEMDNPTDQAITVKIDGEKEYSLAPMELIEVTGLKAGQHTMSVNGGAEMAFNLEKTSMLNPTLSTYVIAEQEYGVGFADDSKWVDVEIDGEEYWGPFQVFENAPIIETEGLHHNVLVPFNDEIETYSNGTVIKRKIFRKGDFIKFYEEDYM